MAHAKVFWLQAELVPEIHDCFHLPCLEVKRENLIILDEDYRVGFILSCYILTFADLLEVELHANLMEHFVVLLQQYPLVEHELVLEGGVEGLDSLVNEELVLHLLIHDEVLSTDDGEPVLVR